MDMKLDKNKLKNKLEAHLGRAARPGEKVNAEKDPVLLLDLVFDLIADLRKDVDALKNK